MLNIKALLLKLVQHYNSIDDIYETGTYTATLASSTSVSTIGTVSGLAAGTWICFGYISWPGKASGFRAIELAYTKSGGSVTNVPVSLVAIPAVSSSYSVMIQTSCAIVSDTTWSLHVRGCQSSGSNMTDDIEWTIKAVRIK